MSFSPSDKLTVLPGVGKARAERLSRLGLERLGDLLDYFPRDYEDRRQSASIREAPVGTPVCIEAMVASAPRLSYIRRGLELVKVRVVDEAEAMDITFFNQSYLRDFLRVGESYVFYGAVELQNRHRTMLNPTVEKPGDQRVTGRIVPVYPLTAGITNKLLVGAINRALDSCLPLLHDPLSETLRQTHGLVGIQAAYEGVHRPKDFTELEQARRRLVFQELLFFSIGLALLRARRTGEDGFRCADAPLEDYYRTLPFSLTAAQRRAAEACAEDLRSGRPMNRLIQGDVGSGKTVVAAAAVWLAAKSGYQSALMVPTELLAEQHYRTLRPLLEQSGLRTALLTASLSAKEKRDVRERLELGMVDLVIGTHALLSGDVVFRSLGLVITDEQHRFGVNQRAALAEKGAGADGRRPHVLVMSATPIPRTLALILYGDLEVSVIDELPPGRQSIDTFRVHSDKRQRLNGFIRKQVREGHQVYIVCPAVEENPEAEAQSAAFGGLPLKSVREYTQELQSRVFPDLRVDYVHGKMSGKEKEAVMAAFASGALDVLVSTTVVEVGVDVPNATLMVVENAERFGLSQLHQLRGRVGRGKAKSYCVLVSDSNNPDTVRRLRALCATNDGFQISEEDLRLRGPGDFFGARQHGLPQLRVADLAGDMAVLQEAQQAAADLLAQDPNLSSPENQALRTEVSRLFREKAEIFN